MLKAYLTNNNSLAVDAFDYETHKSAWSDVARAAEEHNDPGKFTTFIAYEYTASTNIDNENLHRNVIFRSSKAPVRPYSRIDSVILRIYGILWTNGEKKGIDLLAIPHNSNGSNGRMFEMNKSNGEAIDNEYSSQRMRMNLLLKLPKLKELDTHPILSPNDEWADFEIMNSRVGSVPPTYSGPDGSYVRDALLKGLALEQLDRGNPYTFGLIGSSDTHTAASSFDESNYFSKVGILDGIPQGRGSVGLSDEQLDIFINVPEDQKEFLGIRKNREKNTLKQDLVNGVLLG